MNKIVSSYLALAVLKMVGLGFQYLGILIMI